jgi:dTDP-4-amino-4,6-dideoxygalactose transaminase
MKDIRSSSDLAINGAPPAIAEPVHVGRPNLGEKGQLIRYVHAIYDNSWLTNNGPLVRELESKISSLLGVAHCVAICNGTVALEIAIRALGLSGEVIVPSYTFVATAHALSWQSITPVFADIDPQTHNLDPESVKNAITPRTSGIIGVHLWGRPAPIIDLQRIADDHGLALMFDAAHAFNCSYDGRKIGGFGRCEVLSFHATKVFNTFEGGAVLTNDEELANAVRLMRNFGFNGYDNVIHPGTNGKMSEMHAAMGLVNLDALPGFLDANRRCYIEYCDAFSDIEGVTLIAYEETHTPNYQYVVVQIAPTFGASRDEIVLALQAENILARKYFWPGCHRMSPYRDILQNTMRPLSNTDQVASSVVVLPTGPTLPSGTIRAIAAVFRILGK